MQAFPAFLRIQAENQLSILAAAPYAIKAVARTKPSVPWREEGVQDRYLLLFSRTFDFTCRASRIDFG